MGRVDWRAVPIVGTGRATVMHDRRGAAIEAVTGPIVTGTLNVRLDAPFDWSAPHVSVDVPDAVDWSRLDGPWTTGKANLYPVRIGGEDAWALRLARSAGPLDLLEIVSRIRLRNAIAFPATVVLR